MRIKRRHAVAIICFASALNGESVTDTIALGRKALQNEGIATAWKLSQKALAEAPESPVAHEFAGEVLFRRGDFIEAEAEFTRATKLDDKSALGWWGLARIAECTSMHKTADQYLRRAHELDPRDPRIFGDWAVHLRGRQHIEALEQYASMADPNRDEDEREALRQHIQLDRALDGRKLMVLGSAYEKTELPLLKLTNDDTHMRSYGLEVSVNGNKLRLLLDTGASGILIRRAAAERAAVARLSDASFSGFGNATKLPAGYHGLAERVRIGDVEIHDALVNVTNQDIVTNEDGLIGTDVFSQFLVTVDYAAQKLRLDPLPDYHPGDDEPRDRTIPFQMRNAVRVFRFGHILLIPTRVSESREVLFVIDSGAARTLISYDMAAEVSKIKRDDRMQIKGISGQVADVYQTGDLYLQFAGFHQKNLGMTTFDMWDQSRRLGTEVSGFLGLPILNLFTLTIDYRDGLVNFAYTQR